MTIIGIAIVLWTGAIAPQLQLDQLGAIYVQELNYIPMHSHMKQGIKFLERVAKKNYVTVNGKKCSYNQKIINHKKETTNVLTGGTHYVQICTKKQDYSNLFVINCNERK